MTIRNCCEFDMKRRSRHQWPCSSGIHDDQWHRWWWRRINILLIVVSIQYKQHFRYALQMRDADYMSILLLLSHSVLVQIINASARRHSNLDWLTYVGYSARWNWYISKCEHKQIKGNCSLDSSSVCVCVLFHFHLVQIHCLSSFVQFLFFWFQIHFSQKKSNFHLK